MYLLKFNFIVFLTILSGGLCFSQEQVMQKNLPLVEVGSGLTTHFLSPENIQYVDISSQALIGDLPLRNMLRLKLIPDSLKELKYHGGNLGVLTIAGESFLAQYNLAYNPLGGPGDSQPLVEILPVHTRPLDVPGIALSTLQLRNFAIRLLAAGRNAVIRTNKAQGVEARLNQLYSLGDYIFMDISYFNHSRLDFQIDEQRFKIEDRKINKATNVQSVEIEPVFKLYRGTGFKKQYRNIYVIKKLTYPDNKVLNISLTEKELSGRTLNLAVKYRDILSADTF